MRDLQRRVGRRDRDDLARYPAETRDRLEFAATRGHQLHADADAEKRPSPPDDRLAQRLFQSRHRGEAAAAIRERADAGQHDPLGGGDILRPAGHEIAPPAPLSAAARSNAFAAERRLPEP